MNNTERGLKIIDIFTDLREHVNKVKGKIHQGEGYIHENPTCGTTACIGGWLADYFKTKVHFDIYADHKFYRHYQNGITKLADKLDLDVITHFVFLSGLWHNTEGAEVFDPTLCAYNRNEVYNYITIDDVCADWVQFGYELVAEGE